MARMSIDDKFLRDPRVHELALALGISRFDAMGRLLAVYAICYDLERDVLTTRAIDIAAEREGFADAVFEADLAVNVRGGMRIRGALERIEYLQTKSESGRIGGIKSGESRRNSSKQKREAELEANEARRNPPDPAPDPAPDPVPDPVPERKKTRGKRAVSFTADEIAKANLILARLSHYSHVAYSGTDSHLQLIIGRLREGYTQGELRAVIALQADRWRGNEAMATYLRPETLFGPKAIQRYIDAARTSYADDIAKVDRKWTEENATQPPLNLDGGDEP
jgi:uncharacterized phage protein (TIGR02220 family)